MKIINAIFTFFLFEVEGFLPSQTFTSRIQTKSIQNINKKINEVELRAWSPFKKEVEAVEVLLPDEIEASPLETKNFIAAGVWIGLVTYAFLLAPGSMGSPADNELIKTLVSQPVPRPTQINEIWFAIWNCFTIVPAVLAALTAPSGRNQRLPAAPFLWGSGAFGFFSLGPYFATRSSRTDVTLRKDELGWASRVIFENRVFGIVLTALALSIPFSSDLLVPGFDWGAKLSEFGVLFSESRFVAVASADIAIMSLLSSVLVAEDCQRRGLEDKSLPIAAGTLLFPVIGPTLYLAVRPGLEE